MLGYLLGAPKFTNVRAYMEQVQECFLNPIEHYPAFQCHVWQMDYISSTISDPTGQLA